MEFPGKFLFILTLSSPIVPTTNANTNNSIRWGQVAGQCVEIQDLRQVHLIAYKMNFLRACQFLSLTQYFFI